MANTISTSSRDERSFSFISSMSSSAEHPEYRITLSDGSQRDILTDENGQKYYLIPNQIGVDSNMNLVVEDSEQQLRIYLP